MTSALPEPGRQHVRRRHRRARRALLHLHPVHPDAVVDADGCVDLRDPRRRDERPVVGADRPRHPRGDRPRPRGRRGRHALPVHERGAPHPARRRRTVDGGRTREGVRRLAVPRRVDHRGVCARGAEAVSARRLVLPRQRRRRHRRPADRPHGDRRALAVGARAVGEPPSQPDRPHRGCRRGVVVARTRDARPRSRRRRLRRLVDDLARLRERLPHPRPADPARADPVG